MSKKAVKIQPIGKRILVKPEEVETTTPGGLVIPPSAQGDSKPETGIVIKLGTGADDFEFSVKEGDRVFYKKYSPDELEYEGDVYYIMVEEDVLAVVD